MKKFCYYFRITSFCLYLIAMFLLIDKLYRPDIFGIIYFIFNIIYGIILILTILSKKDSYKNSIYYNVSNIIFYIYTFSVFSVTFNATQLEIISNELFFHFNYIFLSIYIIALLGYALFLNKNDSI